MMRFDAGRDGWQPAPGLADEMDSTTWHEAGHAVAVLALGGRLLAVGTVRVGRELGRAIWTGLDGRPDVIASLAGSAALAVAGFPSPYAGARVDYGRVIEMLLVDDLPPARSIRAILPDLEAAELEAREIIRRYGHELAAGAAALAEQGFMTGSQFARAAGGQFAAMAAALEAAEPPPAPAFVVIDRCDLCRWQLPIPHAAYLATPTAELELWRSTLRGLLCYGPHGQGE